MMVRKDNYHRPVRPPVEANEFPARPHSYESSGIRTVRNIRPLSYLVPFLRRVLITWRPEARDSFRKEWWLSILVLTNPSSNSWDGADFL